MLDQAYEQGCEVALNELAETFGSDVVEELVKIAKDKEREYIGAGIGGAAGAAGGGYGAHRGAKHMLGKLNEGNINKHLMDYQKKLEGAKFNDSGLMHMKHTRSGIARKVARSGRNIARLAAHGGKAATGAGILAGAAGLGYAGKKLAE